jgi:hypothetical protein
LFAIELAFDYTPGSIPTARKLTLSFQHGMLAPFGLFYH